MFLRGNSSVELQIPRNAFFHKESIEFRFRSLSPHTTLLRLIDKQFGMKSTQLELKLGKTEVLLRLLSSEHEALSETALPCTSDYGTCLDNQSHKLTFTLLSSKIQIRVDDHSRELLNSLPDFIPSKLVFGDSFWGCISDVGHFIHPLKSSQFQYSSDDKVMEFKKEDVQYRAVDFGSCTGLQLLKEASTNSPRRHSPAINIYSPKIGTFMRVPGWTVVGKGTLNITFRTLDNDSLLLFQSALAMPNLVVPETPVPAQVTKIGGDLFILELKNGHPFLTMNTGSGPINLLASRAFVSDGEVHTLTIVFNEGSLFLVVDDMHSLEFKASPNS
ncbi:hypothetical protein Ciccas_003963 [Cichlidogyrus casuarinus]|uniref:Laminin G domain-containing protein n=1 Tax=Cichlidogyrus casuarinus TaxID=1844966 RepID=A0ABD2QCU7_9PLAT